MQKSLIVIHDAATGKIIEREMTDEELDQLVKDQKDAVKRKKEAEAKAKAKEAAQEKLAALGLTVEDLTALGL